jgi:hypothetical protein
MRRPGVRLNNSVGYQVARRAISRRTQRQINLASFIEYLRFCRQHPAYHACIANQLRIFDWIDERRIEVLAEGRPHWVPSTDDFERAMRDCWDDLVKASVFRVAPMPLGRQPFAKIEQ